MRRTLASANDEVALRTFVAVPPPIDDRLLAVYGGLSPAVGVEIQNLAALYTDGLCSKCLTPKGTRNTRRMVIRYTDPLGRRCHGVEAQLDAGPRGPTFALYSKDFISHLTPQERTTLRWRAVRITNMTKTTRVQFELISSESHFPLVRLRGGNPFEFKCPACGVEEPPRYNLARCLPPWLNPHGDDLYRGQPSKYMAASDLPQTVPPCFTIGNWHLGVTLVFSTGRWQALSRELGTTGITVWPVGVVASAMVA